jgi:hypothetical protein
MADSIDTIIQYHREWLEKNGERILGRDSQYLREDIEDGTPQAFQQIPDSLDGLGTYFGILGTVELLDGQKSGWSNISNAIDFRGWGLKLRAESFFRDLGVRQVNLTNYVSRAGCLICVSEKWRGMAEGILRRIDESDNAVDQGYWNLRRFEPFVLECCKIRDGESVSRKLDAPYDNVIRSWGDEVALGSALESVCEYHCENMDDVGGDWDPEFKHSPFDLLPCEVMFVNDIRERLGLSLPTVSHRLVSLLDSRISLLPHETEHELLRKLATAFDRCYA